VSYNEPPNYGTPPPPPPGGGYGGGEYGGGPMGGGDHPQGTTILILGILSIVCCGLFTGIPAIIMGKKALEESKTRRYNNEGLVKAGWICGIIGTALSVLGIIFYGILAVAGASMS
jgi:hypothetical protein